MVKLTLKSIWEQKGINLSAVCLLSLVFSVQLLLCGWVDSYLDNSRKTLDQINSSKLIFALLILISVTSIIALINYIMNKRQGEFKALRLCGATPAYILICKMLHLLVLILLSLLGGTLIFRVLLKVLKQQYEFKGLIPVYIIFICITAAELTVHHFIHRKEDK